LVVAIDGPSGAGKTTVGKRLAERLSAAFLDTGVLYRALTLRALEASVSPDDGEGLARLARDLQVDVRASDTGPDLVTLHGRDVSDAIHSPTVDAFVSQVAAHALVRDALVAPQRRVAESGRAVVAGRDIGTVIFPDAQVKVFLEASGAERARRRAEQSGDTASEAAVQHDMERRDIFDRDRLVAPMEPAPDAVIIETDGVPIDEVVERVLVLVPVALRAHE
jgi:cytidylate kinase